MLFTFAEYFLQINFISLDALSRNSEQITLSEFLKRNKNIKLLCNVMCNTKIVGGCIWRDPVMNMNLLIAPAVRLHRTCSDASSTAVKFACCAENMNITDRKRTIA